MSGAPAAWFTNNIAAPGWTLDRSEVDGRLVRTDVCGECRRANARGAK